MFVRVDRSEGPEPEKGRKGPKPADDGRVRHEIRVRPAPGDGERQPGPLGYVERELPPGGADGYKKARKEGVRSFALWGDPYRRQLLARVVTASAAKGEPAAYEVRGPAGEQWAHVVREPALRAVAGRTRWTVRQGGLEAVGRKGRLFWWWVWWLVSPLQLAVLVAGLVGGGGDGARMPRRVPFRSGGEKVLDYADGGFRFELRVLGAGWDPRVTAALAALLGSHDGPWGDSWDA